MIETWGQTVKRIAVAVAACVTTLVVAGAARAVPPPLVSVGQQARHPTAILGPLPGVDAAFIYVATKPVPPSCSDPLRVRIPR
jgi:hypothetical protein